MNKSEPALHPVPPIAAALPEPLVLTPEELDRVVGGQLTAVSVSSLAQIRAGNLRTGVVVGPLLTPGFGV